MYYSHGYLLAQFLSPKTNLRTDEFGGTPAKRAEIVLRIIRAVRKATSKEFCIGIKMNSVDAAASESIDDVLEQIRLIAECGIDFIEISGGTYEDPKMMTVAPITTPGTTKESTLKRESFFLEFAQAVRKEFPSLLLMVTGGFRTRVGMEAALASGGCDLVGIGRPATVKPRLPKEVILNTDVPDEKAHVALTPIQVPFLIKHFPLKQVGAGAATKFYADQIQRMGTGLEPLDGIIA
jgi:2,4-dienoyl-CoA reductase-like NADH-dependent reductase (Old Yellow Enzyme family)